MVVVTFFESRPFLTVRLVASNVALSMTPLIETDCPTRVVVPLALRSAPAMVTVPPAEAFSDARPPETLEPTPRLPPAVMVVRRLVLAVSDVVADLRFDVNAMAALLFSSAEVMLTPFTPVSVALPPAAMSEPLMVSVLPAATERLPPLVRLVPLNVCVLLLEDVVVTFFERKPFLTVRLEASVVSVVVTPVMRHRGQPRARHHRLR